MRDNLSGPDLMALVRLRGRALRQERYGVPEAAIQVSAPLPYVEHVRSYTEGYFAQLPSLALALARLYVHNVSPEQWLRFDRALLVPPLRRAALTAPPEAICLVDDGDRAVHLLLHGGPAPRALQLVTRVLRALVLRELHDQGYAFFHAACFTLRGMGVAVIGARSAGKTTTLLQALEHSELALVGNDKIAVAPEAVGDGETALGFPIQAGIRHGSILALEKGPLRAYLTNAWAKRFGTAPVQRDGGDRLQIRPQELATAAGTTVTSCCRLAMAIAPRLDPQATAPTLTRLPDAEARKLWTRHHLDGATEVFPEQAALAGPGKASQPRTPGTPTYLLNQPPSSGPATLRLLEDLMFSTAPTGSE